jgi:hypothetical protein
MGNGPGGNGPAHGGGSSSADNMPPMINPAPPAATATPTGCRRTSDARMGTLTGSAGPASGGWGSSPVAAPGALYWGCPSAMSSSNCVNCVNAADARKRIWTQPEDLGLRGGFFMLVSESC